MTTILAPDEGRLFSIGGDRVTVNGVADALGVGFALIDYRAAPGIAGPPLHVQRPSTKRDTCCRDGSKSRWATNAAASAPAASCWCRIGPRTPSSTPAMAGARWIGVLRT